MPKIYSPTPEQRDRMLSLFGRVMTKAHDGSVKPDVVLGALQSLYEWQTPFSTKELGTFRSSDSCWITRSGMFLTCIEDDGVPICELCPFDSAMHPFADLEAIVGSDPRRYQFASHPNGVRLFKDGREFSTTLLHPHVSVSAPDGYERVVSHPLGYLGIDESGNVDLFTRTSHLEGHVRLWQGSFDTMHMHPKGVLVRRDDDIIFCTLEKNPTILFSPVVPVGIVPIRDGMLVSFGDNCYRCIPGMAPKKLLQSNRGNSIGFPSAEELRNGFASMPDEAEFVQIGETMTLFCCWRNGRIREVPDLEFTGAVALSTTGDLIGERHDHSLWIYNIRSNTWSLLFDGSDVANWNPAPNGAVVFRKDGIALYVTPRK